jgi:putative transposase
VFFYLYVILDIYSRYVVGWMVAERASEALARELITASCGKQRITPGQLTIHADRGSQMTAKTVAELMIDLGIVKSHARPRVPDDNPFSEAQFKTLKYRPGLPKAFGSVQDARAHCRPLFDWYNNAHYHSSLALLTPATVHYGTAASVVAKRQEVLDAAYAAHPERFVGGPPQVPAVPEEVWINGPALELDATPHQTNGTDHHDQTAPTAPIQEAQPGAQVGSMAAEGREDRTIDAAEHPATNPSAAQVNDPQALQ